MDFQEYNIYDKKIEKKIMKRNNVKRIYNEKQQMKQARKKYKLLTPQQKQIISITRLY